MDAKKFNRERFRNKYFWLAMVSAVLLLIQQLGLDKYIPANMNDITATILTILTMVGIVVDPSTPGLYDGTIWNEPEKVKEIEDKKETVEKTEEPKKEVVEETK